MQQKLKQFLFDETGATAIEYGMIAGLVFLAIVGAVTALGQGVSDMLYGKIEAAL